MKHAVTLVGDSVENPANAVTMLHAAEMFGAGCRFRDTKGLADSPFFSAGLPTVEPAQIPALHPRLVACDNLPRARDIYGFDVPEDFALLVGNERRGLSHELLRLATDSVRIPMISRRINCLNVAAASAVALFYLTRPRVGSVAIRKDPASRRPELLLYQPVNHFELGSTVRSAAAFGWERAFIEDPHAVWFGSDRITRSEGRAAARRGKNEILLIPCAAEQTPAYPRVTVVTCQPIGTPLPRVNLARGPSQLLIIPDETGGVLAPETWNRFGEIEFAHLPLPQSEFTYHYRLIASIVLAEISRQVGRRPPTKVPTAPTGPIYDRALQKLAVANGEPISLDDLMQF